MDRGAGVPPAGVGGTPTTIAAAIAAAAGGDAVRLSSPKSCATKRDVYAKSEPALVQGGYNGLGVGRFPDAEDGARAIHFGGNLHSSVNHPLAVER